MSYEKDVFKSRLVKNAILTQQYGFPILKKCEIIPEDAISFVDALRTTKFENFIHFYIHDEEFERVWRTPERYLPLFKKFSGVISTDFSLYRELPLSMQIWNTYRNRAIGYWLQQNGVDVIPNIRWGDERTYHFAFEGISKGGTVSVSTNGCIRDKLDRYYFNKGLAKMVEVIEPDVIVNYSYTPDDIFKKYKDDGIKIVHLKGRFEKMKERMKC